jgi:hypothetical protein
MLDHCLGECVKGVVDGVKGDDVGEVLAQIRALQDGH